MTLNPYRNELLRKKRIPSRIIRLKSRLQSWQNDLNNPNLSINKDNLKAKILRWTFELEKLEEEEYALDNKWKHYFQSGYI